LFSQALSERNKELEAIRSQLISQSEEGSERDHRIREYEARLQTMKDEHAAAVSQYQEKVETFMTKLEQAAQVFFLMFLVRFSLLR